MTLALGTRLGPYEIQGLLGAGGMGEVYRARDTRLDRDVAIKTLPDLFAADGDRVARFEREAKTLAALNHPNIAAIYGIEQGSGTSVHALVMELVEGPTLEDMIHGPHAALPVAEVVTIARQIAEALEAAHEQGIIHRDLKPANVKVRPDGTVKVLDFGLAKALDPAGSGIEPMNSPTLTARATQLGIVLGTAAYMAPEQAKGKPVDRRADIWAFGVMLHEMLTGQRLYGGETAPETLAHVIASDPNLASLPPSTPARLRALIARCLVKDPKARLRDIGEARLALSDATTADAPAPAPPSRRSRLSWGIAAVASLAALAFAVLWWRSSAPIDPAPLMASIEFPANSIGGGAFAISPDGTRLVMQAFDANTGRGMLWLRDMASGTVSPIKQTEGAERPFWSPDSRQIAFFAETKLKRLDLQNGVVTVLADAPTSRGGTWGADGRIVFAGEFRAGLQVVNAAGGAPKPFTTLQKEEKSHRWPVFLPDGRHVVFLAQRAEGNSRTDPSTIDVVAADGSDRRTLIGANSSVAVRRPWILDVLESGRPARTEPRSAAGSHRGGSVCRGLRRVVRQQRDGRAPRCRRPVASFTRRERPAAASASSGSTVPALARASSFRRRRSTAGLRSRADAKRLAVGLTPPGARDLRPVDLRPRARHADAAHV